MNCKYFEFVEKKKCFDLTNFVPPTALTKRQALELQRVTSADNSNYSEVMAQVPTVVYVDPIRAWSKDPRWFKWFLKLKDYSIKDKVDFGVCFVFLFVASFLLHHFCCFFLLQFEAKLEKFSSLDDLKDWKTTEIAQAMAIKTIDQLEADVEFKEKIQRKHMDQVFIVCGSLPYGVQR